MQVDVSLNSVQHSPDFEFTWKIDFQMGQNVYHMCAFYMVHSIHTDAVSKGLKIKLSCPGMHDILLLDQLGCQRRERFPLKLSFKQKVTIMIHG